MLIHLAIIIFLANQGSHKLKSKPYPAPIIKSYLLIKTTPKAPPLPDAEPEIVPEALPETEPEPELTPSEENTVPKEAFPLKPELQANDSVDSTELITADNEVNTALKPEAIETAEPEQAIPDETPPIQDLESHTQAEQNNTDTTPTSNILTSPFGAAQNYFDQLNSNELNKLSKQALSDFNQPKALTKKKGTKDRAQMIKELTNEFAGPKSNIKVVAKNGHDETLLLLNGSCFQVKRNERNEQVWSSSNACGNYDPFNGQLQRSLNKYLKK